MTTTPTNQAREDAKQLRYHAAGLTYNDTNAEGEAKHRLHEIAMRIETGFYTSTAPAGMVTVPVWRDIATAPKDGSVILIWRYYLCAVRWVGGEEWQWEAIPIGAMHAPFENNGFMSHDSAVTHWMPLPPAPAGMVS